MEQGLAAGADSYLTHPADPAVLIATVKALLFARKADIIKRAADARFRTVFELASSGIALLDAQLNCQDVNPAFCAIAGALRNDLIGRPVASLIAPADAEQLERAHADLQQQGHWDGMLALVRVDGSLADVEWRIASEAGTGTCIAIATDIT